MKIISNLEILMKKYQSKKINSYNNLDSKINQCMNLIQKNDKFCLNRKCFNDGHFTTSAILFNKKMNKVLLTNHKFLKMWLHLGGHFENDENVLASAVREVKEESGIDKINIISDEIFYIDIHLIPENKIKNEKEHYHYDLTFLLQAESDEFKISDESEDLKWFSLKEIEEMNDDYYNIILEKLKQERFI